MQAQRGLWVVEKGRKVVSCLVGRIGRSGRLRSEVEVGVEEEEIGVGGGSGEVGEGFAEIPLKSE